MERIEALALLERITRHWSQHLSMTQHDHWVSILCDLDATQAGTTFARMMRQQHAPSPAQFLAEAQQHQPAITRSWCAACGNTGVVSDDNHPHHWPGQPDTMPRIEGSSDCICNVAKPCHCNLGKQAADWFRRADAQRNTHSHA